ncbi:MAG TPA: NAD(P)/FAD-dependent oxidoreductase [Armatimonadota bacterium]|nr:NAD(P)/FAD-dependent oxidoreductase [Armatimonadota bacterium]
MAEHMDAVVVGAGPAGCAFAVGFASGGGCVTLVDGSGQGSKPCGGAFPPAQLSETVSGALAATKPLWSVPSRVQFETADGQSESWPVPQGALVVCARQRLDEALRNCAAEAGARLVRGRATNIHRADGRWRLQVGRTALSAGLLVGADGAAGSHGVREALGLPPTRGLWARISHVDASGSGLPLRVRALPVPGYCWCFPGTEATSLGYLVVNPIDFEQPEVRSSFARFAADAAPGAPMEAEWSGRIPYLDRPGAAAPACGPDWALVGDAAGLCDPITGAGIAAALRSGALAAATARTGRLGATDALWWTGEVGESLARSISAFGAAMRLGGEAGRAAYHALLRQAFGGHPR